MHEGFQMPNRINLTWPDHYFNTGPYHLQYKHPALILQVIRPCAKIVVCLCKANASSQSLVIVSSTLMYSQTTLHASWLLRCAQASING